MRPCRPRRRGHWGRHLSPISILDSPLTSDSDAFPCDSSCSGESISSQDHVPPSLYSRRHVRSFPPYHYSPTCLLSNPHPLTTPFRPDIPAPHIGPTSIRDLSLCEYAAAELPDLGFLFRPFLPAFTSPPSHLPYPTHHSSSPRSPTSVPTSQVSSPSASLRSSVPPRCLNHPSKHTHRTLTVPDPSKPSPHGRVQPSNRNDALHTMLSVRDQSPRHESSARRSPPRSVRTAKLSLGRDTRRFPDDIAISRQQAQRSDPDSMHRSLLVERLCSLYKDIVNSEHTSSRR